MQHATIRTALQPMTPDERAFFTGLGHRIAQARKDADLTQQQVADALGLSQPQYASYEVGRRRVPVSMLPGLTKVLGVSIEALVADEDAAQVAAIAPRRTRRGPPSRLERQLDAVARLPKARQKFVSDMLDTVLAQHQGQEAATAS